MTLKAALLITVGVFLGVPVLVYFTIWWGVSAYHRATAYSKQQDQEINDDNNSSNVNDN